MCSEKGGEYSHHAKGVLQQSVVVLYNVPETVVAEKAIEYIASIVTIRALRKGSHDTLLGMAHCEEQLEGRLRWLPSAAGHDRTAHNATQYDAVSMCVRR